MIFRIAFLMKSEENKNIILLDQKEAFNFSRAMRWVASQKTVVVRVNSGHDSIDGALD